MVRFVGHFLFSLIFCPFLFPSFLFNPQTNKTTLTDGRNYTSPCQIRFVAHQNHRLVLCEVFAPQIIYYLLGHSERAPGNHRINNHTAMRLVGRQGVLHLRQVAGTGIQKDIFIKSEQRDWRPSFIKIGFMNFISLLLLTLISVEGWSIKTISDSSPSNRTLTDFSPNSSSEEGILLVHLRFNF